MLRSLSFVLALMMVPTACASETTRPGGSVTNFETPGNLAPTQDRGCIALPQADSSMSPADLALSLQKCLAKDKYQDAARLMVLMLARARFDTYRVADRTAHQAESVLPMTVFQSLRPAQRNRLSAELDRMAADRTGPEYRALCQEIRALGIPGHDPGYMIAHGMNAVLGRADNPLVAGFNAKKAWADTLRDYIKCPS